MDRTNCYFAKEPPQLELRGDHIFLTPSHGHYEVAFAPHVLQRFIVSADAILAEWRADKRKVVRFKTG